jgi:hypothetical protein
MESNRKHRRIGMKIRARTLALVAVLALGTPLAAVDPAPAAPARASSAARLGLLTGSLRVSPSVHLGGQAVHFAGNIPALGVRTIHLQLNMLRPGDHWTDVPSSTFHTDLLGGFRFVFPAPSMFDIAYRVVSGSHVTRKYVFNAPPQEITLAPPGADTDFPIYRVSANRAFAVVADTTPDVRSTHPTPPVVLGRVVVLQERTDRLSWRALGHATVADSSGEVAFTLPAPGPGQRVLRAVQKRWTEGANDIGWSASFPAYFTSESWPDDLLYDDAANQAAPVGDVTESASRPTAALRYHWGFPLYDFAWDRGQDLDTPPGRGTRLVGAWADTSTGTGRVTPYNGALVLQSKLRHIGPGDLGTTTATLRHNSQAHGRWEFRLQEHLWEKGGAPYRFILELVPDTVPPGACAPSAITVADFTAGRTSLSVGIRNKASHAAWRRTQSDVVRPGRAFNGAVEVGRDHVTWFRDAKPVGTVKDPHARLGVALTPRLSLVGEQVEMNGAQVDSDWQRSFRLESGTQVTNAPGLTRFDYTAAC